MAELMGLRAYARHRGCALSAVQRAIAAGRITPVLDDAGAKLIDPVVADSQWQRNTDPDQSARATAGRAAPAAARAPAAQAGGEAPELELSGGRDSAFMRARTRREEAAAALAELELRERAGGLVAVADIHKQLGNRLRAHRDGVLSIASRIAERLVNLPTAAAVAAILQPELERALADLARPLDQTQEAS
jgi:hypothetical protein